MAGTAGTPANNRSSGREMTDNTVESSLIVAYPDYKARFEAMVYGYGEVAATLGISDDEAACANGLDAILSTRE